jgi:hypothetical protein
MLPYEERAKGVLKCYLILNKGRWFSAKELSEFIQSNKDFRLGKYGKGLSPIKVSNLLRKNYFRDLETKKLNDNRKVYRYVR